MRSLLLDESNAARTLRYLCPPTTFLPYLRDLRCEFDCSAEPVHLYPFITPSLTSLSISGTEEYGQLNSSSPSDDTCWCPLLETIYTQSPDLRSLKITWHCENSPSDLLSRTVEHTLIQLKHLESLTLSLNLVLSPTIIATLSTLPKLKLLTISQCSFRTDFDNFRPLHSPIESQSLNSLQLDVPYNIAHGLLGAFSHTQMAHLGLSLTTGCSQDMQVTLIQKAVEKFRPTLSSLHFKSVEFADDDLDIPLPMDIFRIAQRMDLVDVRIGLVDPIRITDSLCKDMAASWPRLEHLELPPFRMILHSTPHMVTLAGLLPFQSHCLNLHTLHIQLDATGSQWKGIRPESTVCSKVSKLYMYCSPLDCPAAVAIFLRRLFPVLDHPTFDIVTAGCYEQYSQLVAWTELRQYMQTYVYPVFHDFG